jgi:uncharacterized protein
MNLAKIVVVFLFVLTQNTISAQDVFDAARTGDISRLRVLQKIKGDTLNSLNENGFSPLLLATYRNQNKTVKFLIQQKANVNQTSQEGTPIIAAAYKGNIAIVKMLIKNGAFLNAVGHDGATALIFATQNSDDTMIKLLLKNKADATVKDIHGKTALDYAKYSKNKSISLIFGTIK